MNNLILAIILSFLPVSELRLGLPIAIDYALKNNISLGLIFLIIVSVNILAIFFVFFFLDILHEYFMKINSYKRFFSRYMKRIEKKGRKIEKRMGFIGYFALMLFVSVPFPTTGAWTGCVIAWFLKLNRKKSFISIASGVILAGLIVLSLTLSIFNI
jgi:uncharacterized membrane protein